MGNLYNKLSEDVRLQEGLQACINCGTCTAICPAAEFYQYDPRKIVDIVQSKDDAEIEKLLKSDAIWYCGECMSCVTRCPRKNAPGLIIMALRSLSQDLGYFIESEKGRQQLALKRAIGESILDYGYCLYVRNITYENHQEAGPVWQWSQNNVDALFARLGGNLDGEGPGVLRKIPQSDLDELKKIFDITGTTERFDKIEECSHQKATEMKMSDEEYFNMVFTHNSDTHGR